jgi:hypothetical protein
MRNREIRSVIHAYDTLECAKLNEVPVFLLLALLLLHHLLQIGFAIIGREVDHIVPLGGRAAAEGVVIVPGSGLSRCLVKG